MADIGLYSGRIAPGLYRYGEIEVVKVADKCWRITNPGYGHDFKTLWDAYWWVRRGGPEGRYPYQRSYEHLKP